jgi:hypothetical protein
VPTIAVALIALLMAWVYLRLNGRSSKSPTLDHHLILVASRSSGERSTIQRNGADETVEILNILRTEPSTFPITIINITTHNSMELA